MHLKDKVAAITGGSGAIGAATAKRLAEAGARIVAGYNSNPDWAEAVMAAVVHLTSTTGWVIPADGGKLVG